MLIWCLWRIRSEKAGDSQLCKLRIGLLIAGERKQKASRKKQQKNPLDLCNSKDQIMGHQRAATPLRIAECQLLLSFELWEPVVSCLLSLGIPMARWLYWSLFSLYREKITDQVQEYV